MHGWWLVSYVAMWILLGVLAVFNVAILRQLGLLYVRLGGSLGALQTSDGPEIGGTIPITSVHEPSGLVRSLIPAPGRHQALVFMSPTCEICDPMIPLMPSFHKGLRRDTDLLIVMTAADKEGKFRSWRAGEPPVVVESSLAELFALPAMPYGVVIDDRGRIASKGVINNVQQIESIVNEAKLGDGAEGLQLEMATTVGDE